MAHKINVPPKAFKQPVQPIPKDANNRVFKREIQKSGLLRMMERCYPMEKSQHN